MHTAEAIESIAALLEKGLANLRPGNKLGGERRVTVYRYALPEPAAARMSAPPDGPSEMAPAEMNGPEEQEPEAEPERQTLWPYLDTATPDDYEGMMPCVVVAPLSFEETGYFDQEALLTVSILAGVYSRDPRNIDGPHAVVNILEEARRVITSARFAGRYTAEPPLVWEMYDEGTKPLWFGEMRTQWRLFAPQPVIPFAYDNQDYKGDLLIKPKEVKDHG